MFLPEGEVPRRGGGVVGADETNANVLPLDGAILAAA